MTCPKCSEANLDDSNFCRFCSEPLKEKCPECGEMEWVDRVLCETTLKEAVAEKNKYSKRAEEAVGAAVFSVLVIIFALLIATATFPQAQSALLSVLLSTLIVILGFAVGFFVCVKADRQGERREFEFLQKFPHYAEILKKANYVEVERGEEK